MKNTIGNNEMDILRAVLEWVMLVSLVVSPTVVSPTRFAFVSDYTTRPLDATWVAYLGGPNSRDERGGSHAHWYGSDWCSL